MSIVLRAAMVAVSLGTIGPAYAGAVADSEAPGVVAQTPTPNMRSVETAQKGQVPRSNGTAWIFPPIGKYLPQ